MSTRSDVELILVGNELLRGDRRDSHLAYLGRRLLEIGARLDGAHVVGDDRDRLAALVAARVGESRVLVVTGGLGPTHDDITRDALARGIGVELEFSDGQWAAIKALFARSGWKISESNRRQAYFPRGATPVANPRGTAPGFVVDAGGCMIAVLPGPPREFRAMLDTDILPRIERLIGRAAPAQKTFRTAGVGESKLTPLLESLLERYPELTVASLPQVAGVDLLVRAKRDPVGARRGVSLGDVLGAFEGDLRAALGHRIYASGDVPFEAVIGELLTQRVETLAVAESLTGGLMGKRLTDVAGSSGYLLADVVAYSNDSKMTFLGVRKESLAAHGAVSETVCREMADGVRLSTGATYGMATTGIAGPTGGSDEKPVGLCYYGLSWEGGADIRDRVFPGERDAVRERVVWAALYLLYERLLGAGGD